MELLYSEINDEQNPLPVKMHFYQTSKLNRTQIKHIVVVILLILAVYLPTMWFVFSNRNHPCILPRSPKLIVLEGVSLFFDSAMNFIIMTDGVSDEWDCSLGIITTVTFHYIAFASIVLRAYRIQAFFNVYNDFFRRQEENDNIDSSTQIR